MSTLRKYRAYCLTEDRYVEYTGEDKPHFCPNDRRHVLDDALTELQGLASYTPPENINDPAYDTLGKARVSMAESMIGSDFNYGFGPGEWETLEKVNNIPGVYYRYGDKQLSLTLMVATKGSRDIIVTCPSPHGLLSGQYIHVTGCMLHSANGSVQIRIIDDTRFTFKSKLSSTVSGNVFDVSSTYVYRGRYFEGSDIKIKDILTDGNDRTRITVKTEAPTGFRQGSFVNFSGTESVVRVNFAGEDVIPGDDIQHSVSINTGDGTGLTGTNAYPVIPYEWRGQNGMFFSGSNVDTVANTITLGENQSAPDDKYVAYFCPPWETPVTGLESLRVYKTSVTNENVVQLRSLEQTPTQGFKQRIYNDVIDILGNFTLHRYTTSTITNTDISSVGGDMSSEIYGCFKASTTKEHAIELRTKDADACLWIIKGSALLNDDNYDIIDKNSTKSYSTTSTTISLSAGEYMFFVVRFTVRKRGSVRFRVDGIDDDSSGQYFFNTDNVAVATSSVVNLQGNGTFATSHHQLLPCCLITGVDDNRLVVSKNLQSISDTMNFVLISNNGIGIGSLKTSGCQVDISQYTKYKAIDLEPGLNTMRFGVMNDTTNSIVEWFDVNISGSVWAVPIVEVPESNTLFFDNSAFADEHPVTYSVQSGSGPTGVVSGEEYNLKKMGNAFARLERQGVPVSFVDTGNGVFSISQTTPRDNKNSVQAAKHGLFAEQLCTYCNLGNVDVPGLNNGSSYKIDVVNEDMFRLETVGGAPVSITESASNDHCLFVDDSIGIDGKFQVSRIVDQTTFEMYTNNAITNASYTFSSSERVVEGSNLLYFYDHGLITGTKVKYTNSALNADIGGLESGSNYYVGRVNNNFIKLYDSESNAILGTSNIQISNSGTGNEHNIEILSLMRWKMVSDNAITLQNSAEITNTTGQNFYSLLKVNDEVEIEYYQSPASLQVLSADSNNNTLTFTGEHGLTSGDWIVYDSGSAANLDDGSGYYASPQTGDTVKIYGSYDNFVAESNEVSITDTDNSNYGTFTYVPLTDTVSTSVHSLSCDDTLVVEEPLQTSSASARIYRKTSCMPTMDCIASHRGYDGGIRMQGFLQTGLQFLRQSKVYFTYQSGKATQATMSVNFNPPVEISFLSRNGTTATCTTLYPHNMVKTLRVRISGAIFPEWNGKFVVAEIIDENTFEFELVDIPDEIVARGNMTVTVLSWSQCSSRCGIFDDQNGFYMEYNGDNMNIVRRNSILQISGTVTTSKNSCKISGSGTQFKSSLTTGDYIVIKGHSYLVVSIVSDLELYVQPAYRGAGKSGLVITKTVETRISQKNFNIDTLDGKGISTYNIDPSKIQMVVIEYTWYGAGRAQVGVKGVNGEIIYAHRFIHNNNMFENFTRTGSLPVRYEISTTEYPTYIPLMQHWGVSVVMEGGYDRLSKVPISYPSDVVVYTGIDTVNFVADTTTAALTLVQGMFFSAVRIAVDSSNFSKIKYVQHGTPISGSGIPAGTTTLGVPAKAGDGGYLWISQLPTSFSSTHALTLGNPDNVLPYFRNVISFRVSPSVDNDRVGNMSERDVINRTQIILTRCVVNTTHDISVDVILNGTPNRYEMQRVGLTSFVEVMKHTDQDRVENGLVVFSFIAKGGDINADGVSSYATTEYVFDKTLPLTNSINGGDWVFPDGPELVTLRFRPKNLACAGVTNPLKVYCNIEWYEK